ncbi:MAG: hypothetical protein IJP29_06670 [Lachnospiraceae bacterium]|nr:hypothetical protein [Lachnospiraceae bacterium]
MEFIMNHLFMSSILGVGIVSIFLQWIMSISLRGYVKASANMKTTNKKMMINLKNQFEAIYGMDYSVQNVGAYVEKYLLKLKFMGISYSFWEKLPILSAAIVSLVAAGSAFYAYQMNSVTALYIEILFSYGVCLACFTLFAHIFGIKGKKQQMQIQLVDYLENYLVNRVKRGKEASKEMKLLDATMEEAFIEGVAQNEELTRAIMEEEKEKNLVKQGEKEIAATKEMSDIELLEDFVESFLA